MTEDDILAQAEAFLKWTKNVEHPDSMCDKCDVEEWLPQLLAEAKRLQAEGERLTKMFADDVYIESAHMTPGEYNINLKGKGVMLLYSQLLKVFRESGGKNFLTSTLQMGFGDPITLEQFELTIQKLNGDDSPAQKIERLTKELDAWKAKAIEERASKLDDSGDPCVHRTHYEYCELLDACCHGFPSMWKSCPEKFFFVQKAAHELEEEMRNV